MVSTFASFSPPIPTCLPSFPLSATLTPLPSLTPILLNHPFLPISHSNLKLRRIHVAPPESTVLQTAQEIVSATDPDDGISYVISALLLVAFTGLSILTFGVKTCPPLYSHLPFELSPSDFGMGTIVQVIYLGVTDFLQKRDKDKFEKEEAANSGNQKKKKLRARLGLKGFGQKIDEDDQAIS